ncbi:hypothetical protein EYF80_045954 [Liparis tanakae]|uniref:Uncharacterized protein n=1 Tax=Liparis tanakae TaxID=230148 RepID=A0A4Z2FSK6_9TELE|nr:hypothetical protein EYF80_045954 [Liparis tanakae]
MQSAALPLTRLSSVTGDSDDSEVSPTQRHSPRGYPTPTFCETGGIMGNMTQSSLQYMCSGAKNSTLHSR